MYLTVYKVAGEALKTITEQLINSLAPNAAAVNNGKKISKSGGFVKLAHSEDDTFYMGECKGSGKSNYITSADFIDEASPVFRCSCPSRQFPCKHSLALLFEMSEGKSFEVCEIPQDIADKRAKKEAKAAKAAEKAADAGDGAEEKKSTKKSSAAGKAARTKKIKKQLEGLKLAGDMLNNLLKAGLGTMGGNSVNMYKDLAKQLGDYYLSGPQLYVRKLIVEIEHFKKDGDEGHYKTAIGILIRLRALIKKSEAYLNEKLEADNTGDDDSILFEELGGIWKLENLNELGLKKENATLMQLAFYVTYDEAGSQYIDTGWWADADTGEVSVTYNYRPVKALKYIKQEDTVFGTAHIPVLTYYPGDVNRRIRWDGITYSESTTEQLKKLSENAKSNIPDAVKTVKNYIKNTLSDNFVVMLFKYEQIGKSGEDIIMCDTEGNSIVLDNMKDCGVEPTTDRLLMTGDNELYKDKTLLGAFFYDEKTRSIRVQPYSIITEEGIVRLLY